MADRYAKLQDGIIEFAPKNKGAILNYNLDIDQMLADGYKLFKPCELPEETNRAYHVEYTETDSSVIESIVFDETQEEADERERQAEEDRVNRLTMTALDFLNVLYSFGLTRQQVRDYLDANPELDDQLKYCQNVWCGVVKQLCPLKVANVTITAAMIEQAFKEKHGLELENN